MTQQAVTTGAIEWFFTQTPEGATYLQVIIISVLLFLALRFGYITFLDFIETMKCEFKDDKQKNQITWRGRS